MASDPERLARFDREAQVLASLNHPHIAHIYGFEDCGDTRALVMELVDGPTLADLIVAGTAERRGGSLDPPEAIRIARQIASRTGAPPQLLAVLNWFGELKRLVPNN